MTGILTLQRRHREIGRLRLGTKGPQGNPVKLDTWRFTSRDPALLASVADLYGGTVRPWDEQHEVISEVSTIPVMVPAQNINAQQSMALWGKGGLIRRCDTETSQSPTGEVGVWVEQPCVCAELDADGDEKMPRCSPHTLARFWLPDVAGIGTWVLNSTGWNAAAELATAVDLLAGRNIRATLAIEQRETKRQGQKVHKYVVPVLQVPVSLTEVLEAGRLEGTAPVRSLGQGRTVHTDTGEITEPDEPDEAVPDEAVPSEPVLLPLADTTPSNVTDIADRAIARFWTELDDLIGAGPPTGTMDENETKLRKLFRLLDQTGVIEDHDRALHASLSKRGLAHVGDMRAAELKEFCGEAWTWAYKLIGLHEKEVE